MSKPEYLTADFVESLRWRADEKRRQAEVLTAEAKQIDAVRMDFEQRVRDYEKWKECDKKSSV